jgi:hypothetical protein
MKISEMIAVLQHAEKGGVVESIDKNDPNDVWGIANRPVWNFRDNDYRIKPERIPLNEQDLIERELSGKTTRIKYGYGYSLITDFNEQNVYLSDDEFTYEQLAKLEWIDGKPCSKEANNE